MTHLSEKDREQSVISFVTSLTNAVRNVDLDDPVKFAAFRQVAEDRLHEFLQSIADKQWISVEDRLPEIGVDVLVFVNNRYESIKTFPMIIARLTHTSSWPTTRDITHWMPLPEPPTKFKEENK